MGARLSPAQQDLLAGRFSKLLLTLDGDATGRTAMRPGYKKHALPAIEGKAHGGDQYRIRRFSETRKAA
jgi:hypothetical protein